MYKRVEREAIHTCAPRGAVRVEALENACGGGDGGEESLLLWVFASGVLYDS